MHKIWLIIKREYLVKVRKKTFILSTILFPLLYLGLIFGSTWIASRSGKNLRLAFVDSSGLFTSEKVAFENRVDSSVWLSTTSTSPDSITKKLDEYNFDGVVIIPKAIDWQAGPSVAKVKTEKTLSVENMYKVQARLNTIWTRIKNEQLGIDQSKLEILKANPITLKTENINDKTADAGVAGLIGIIAALLTYIILMLYGSQVMMGVTEEKTSRIAEVIISSVKPFQLMLGKIIGIGMVAFTQVLLWVIFVLVIYNLTAVADSASVNNTIGQVQQAFSSTNLPLVLGCFMFYLLGGFFFYASMFAAVGSAVNEDMREAQSLSFPLMLPIIFSMAMSGAIIKDPTGPIAVWGSIIPFTSPVIMMIRIPFGVPGTVPLWQLGLSMATLIAGFVFTTWFAGKIYRTGILMYGKKPTWKEMMKWAFRK